MNRKFRILLVTVFIIAFWNKWNVVTVQAEGNIDDSVYEYFQNSDKKTEKKKTEDTSLPQQNENENTSSQSVGVTGWDIVKTIFVLLIVIGMLIGLLKWLQKKNFSPTVQTVKNLGGTNLGGNKSVQMVKVGNSILVVGIGEDVQLLKEINDKKEVEMIVEQFNNRMDQMMKPQDIVSKATEYMKLKRDKSNKNSSFKFELEKQLNDLTVKRRDVLEENIKKGKKDQ